MPPFVSPQHVGPGRRARRPVRTPVRPDGHPGRRRTV